MQIFLFIIEGKPVFRTSLHAAQACLEDHLRDQRDVSDIWWDDHQPYEARKYLYGSSHVDTAVEDAEVDYETTDQIIWPMEVPSPETKEILDPLLPGGAQMLMSVITDKGKAQIVHRVAQGDWDESRIRPYLVTGFAARAGQALADQITKEST